MKMSEAARLARNEYMRKYRQRPEVKEKEKARKARYWERKAQELAKANSDSEDIKNG